tara:strand:+ start:649 stop:810 length:162 start_codon:yes stop_codon:yes gene_type:complete
MIHIMATHIVRCTMVVMVMIMAITTAEHEYERKGKNKVSHSLEDPLIRVGNIE